MNNIPIVIMAGGEGSRLSEETGKIPKPLVEIGNKPIIWHVMKIYSHYKFNNFIICAGYKQHLIKEYFYNYYIYNNHVKINLETNDITCYGNDCENWKITIVDTGQDTLTSERLKKVKSFITTKNFGVTYSDGVSDVDINALLSFHLFHGNIGTLTAVRPVGRFGALELDTNNFISLFNEKKDNNRYVNGGFIFFNKKVFDYLDDEMLETNVLPRLAKLKELKSYIHDGFWKPMDTLRDKNELNIMWKNNNALWKVWEK